MDWIGPYQVLEALARGGQGAVYRARDPRSEREVAVKLLEATDDPTALARFQREAEALARLRHPHVVAIHDAGQLGPRPYLVMDLVDGSSLQGRLEQEGPLPPAEAAALLQTLAETLAHAHAQGLIHRDLKPHNVLLDRAGRVQLTDFGLAAGLDQERLTRTGQMLGTPGYMAPEQVDGKAAALDVRTDVYGLGATLYALLTGRAPFVGAQLSVITAVLTKPPTPPRELAPQVDRALEALVLRCLAKEPADRYPDAAALADELGRYLAGELRPPLRGRGLVVGLALLVVLVAVLGAWLGREGAPPSPTTAVEPTGTATPVSEGGSTDELAGFRAGVFRILVQGKRGVLTARGEALLGAQNSSITHRNVVVRFLDGAHLLVAVERAEWLLLFSNQLSDPARLPHELDRFLCAATNGGVVAIGGVRYRDSSAQVRDLGTLAVFRYADGRLSLHRRISFPSPVSAVDVSLDGARLALGLSDLRLAVLSVDRLATPTTYVTHPQPSPRPGDRIEALRFSADGRELVSGSAGPDVNRSYPLARWRVDPSGALQPGATHSLAMDHAQCLIADPRGGYLFGTRNWKLRVLPPRGDLGAYFVRDRDDANHSAHLRMRVREAALSRDALFSAAWYGGDTSDGQVARWNLKTRERERLLPISEPARPVSLALSPDERWLAIGHSGPEELVDPERLNDLGRVEVLDLRALSPR